jgi:hypothetical protein
MRVHRISTFGFKHPETNFLWIVLISTIIFRQSWAAVPSNTRRIRLTSWGDLCGVCRYMFSNSSFLLTSEPNSRRVPDLEPLHARCDFTLEGCAYFEGLNSHGDSYCSPNDYVLERNLSGEQVFFNPPWELA